MVIPRWQEAREKSIPNYNYWNRWDQFIALIALLNLSWIFFDVSYLPMRNFWLNKKVHILNSPSRKISLKWLPTVTERYDKIKGIQTNYSTNTLEEISYNLNKSISKNGFNDPTSELLLSQYNLQVKGLLKNLDQSSPRNYEKIALLKHILRVRSGEENHLNASDKLLNISYLKRSNWAEEKYFWENKVMPILRTNYFRVLDIYGEPVDYSWKIDLPFQLIFLIDILIKVIRTKLQFPFISFRSAIFKRWLDLPLILPYLRLFRIAPIFVRISKVKFLPIEPIRELISQWIVAFLAIEIFEVLTLKAIQSIQNIINSPHLPEKIRGMCSYQSPNKTKDSSEVADFLRIWVPLLLREIGPNMRTQLIDIFEHSLQKSISKNSIPNPIKGNIVFEKAESAINYQIASGMVDSLLGISKTAGNQIAKKDLKLEKLTLNAIDRFWEELAAALESDSTLKNSQVLLSTMLEELKVSSLNEFKNEARAKEIIDQLDTITYNSKGPSPN